jgi:hypothetical protein
LKFIINTLFILFSINSSISNAANRIEIDNYNPNDGWSVTTNVYTSDTGDIYAYQPYYPDPYHIDSLSVNYWSFDKYTWLNIDFSTAALGVPLDVGTYENAERFPFNTLGHPGIAYGNTGLADFVYNGSFEVLEITRNTSGAVTSFSANFRISALTAGRVWYTLETPVTSVPEPGNLAMLMAGLGLLSVAVRRSK